MYFCSLFIWIRILKSPRLVAKSLKSLIYKVFFSSCHSFIEETVICPAKFLTLWILLIRSMWCHLICSSIPCFSCEPVVRSSGLMWFPLNCLAKTHHRQCSLKAPVLKPMKSPAQAHKAEEGTEPELELRLPTPTPLHPAPSSSSPSQDLNLEFSPWNGRAV